MCKLQTPETPLKSIKLEMPAPPLARMNVRCDLDDNEINSLGLPCFADRVGEVPPSAQTSSRFQLKMESRGGYNIKLFQAAVERLDDIRPILPAPQPATQVPPTEPSLEYNVFSKPTDMFIGAAKAQEERIRPVRRNSGAALCA